MMVVQKTLINWISDLLWPHRCLGCGLRSSLLCLDCLHAIPDHPAICPLQGGVLVAAGGFLREPLLSSAVWHLKYRNMPLLAEPLAGWLAHNPQVRSLAQKYSVLVPVPLHARRLKERGYNQAELLAIALAPIVGVPVVSDILTRTRHTSSQVTSTGRSERITNMAGAFAAPRPDRVAGKSILLVDDVCTTGATLVACAEELKKAGAHTVAAVVIARA